MSTAFHALKASFNGGEVTPLLDGRVDAAQHATGCRILENFIPRPYGGVMKRPGTEFAGEVKTPASATRLLPFRRSTDTNYVLEFGEEYLRVWRDDNGSPSLFAASVTNPADPGYPGFTAWVTATNYVVGATLVRNSVTYVCTAAHLSSSTNEPGTGATWPDFWDVYYVDVGTVIDESGTGYYCHTRNSPSGVFATDLPLYWHALDAHPDGDFILEIPIPYQTDELFQLQFVQLNDVIFFAHPNHFPRRLTRVSDLIWKLEKVPFEFAPTLDTNETATAVQIQWNTSLISNWTNKGTAYTKGDRVLSIAQSSSSQPAIGTLFTCHTTHTPTAVANDQPGSESAWQTYWNEGTSSITISNWAASTSYALGQKVRFRSVIYQCITAHVSVGLADLPGIGKSWTSRWKVSSGDYDLAGMALQLAATEDTFSADDVGSIWEVHIGTVGRALKIDLGAGSTSIETQSLFLQGAYLFTTNWAAGDAARVGSIILEESFDNVTWSRVREWTLDDANAGNISYSGEAPTAGAWYRVSSTYTTNTTADKALLEPVSSVLKLPFRIDGYTSAKVVTGTVIMPNDQLPPHQAVGVSTTVYKKPAFIETSGVPYFPRAVAFHDSRLWWGGTANHPARMWGSAIDDFYIYVTGANDDDAIDVTLASTESNAIQWMVSQNRQMVIGTTAEEWTLDSGETDDALTPSKIRARRRTRFGSEPLAPLPITDSLLWIQRGGKKVREFAYRFESDSYTAPEMTLLAEHLFRSSRIVQASFQTAPDPIVWAVGDDGVLYGFSYDREQQITAWHRHRTGERVVGDATVYDSFESVATIYGENGADQVWFVVNRGGNRYIERFQTTTQASSILDTLQEDGVNADTCYVDSAMPGVAGDTQSGFSHLDGRSVTAAGETMDGVVYVSPGLGPVGSEFGSGNVILDFDIPAGHWIGLPFTSKLRPMKLEAQLQTGTAQARKWRLNRAALNLIASCGGKVSPSISITGSPIDYQGNEQPYSGQLDGDQYMNGEFSNQLDLYITHTDPTPFNLISTVLKVEVSSE